MQKPSACVSDTGKGKVQSVFPPRVHLGRSPVSLYVFTVATVDACTCHTTYTKSLYRGIHKVVPKCAGTPVKVTQQWRKSLQAKLSTGISVPVWGRI